MAGTMVHPKIAPAIDSGPSVQLWERFRTYKAAKAEWDVWTYSTPESEQDDDRDTDHHKATSDALNAFLLTPAENIADLSLKLHVFEEEEIADGWYMRGPIISLLAKDARRLASAS